MLPQEVVQEFGQEDVATAFQRVILSADKKGVAEYRGRKHSLQQLQRERPTALATLGGKRLFIDRCAAATIAPNRLDDRLNELGAAAEPVSEKADCFIVSHVTNLGQRVLWNICLLVKLRCRCSGTGPVVAYASQLAEGQLQGVVQRGIQSRAPGLDEHSDCARRRCRREVDARRRGGTMTQAEAPQRSWYSLRQLTEQTAPYSADGADLLDN